MSKWTMPSLIPDVIPSVEIKLANKRPTKPRRLVARVLHLGAGLQSSTLAEMVIAQVLPQLDLVIFSDTGDEPRHVYEQVKYLEQKLTHFDISLAIVRASDYGIVHDLTQGTGRFASMPLFTRDIQTGKIGRIKRQCTSEYKIKPSNHYLLDWMLDRGYAKRAKDNSRRVNQDIYIESWFGFSKEEFYRMRRGSLPQWQKQVCPLIDMRMTRYDCKQWLIGRGLRVPRKSSCRVCPFRTDAEWLHMKLHEPNDFEHACQFDDWLRSDDAAERFTMNLRNPVFLHQSCTPLRDIDFNAKKAQLSMDLCNAGSCWT